MGKFQDLTGKKYGYYKVIKHLGKTKHNKNLWELECQCSRIMHSTTYNILSGQKQSCGCHRQMSANDYSQQVKNDLLSKRKINGECWEWTGQKDYKGYGRRVFYQGRRKRKEVVSRISYQLWKGEIPKGKYVCHTCDNPSCFNPVHLWIGSLQDNHKDMMEKKRYAKGEMLPQTKITERDVKEIRKRKKSGESLKSIQKDYNLHYQTIWSISVGKTWSHVK